MNTPDAPLNPEMLDELLSADLDGELASAVAELGFTLDGALAAIAATPESARRRAELARARELIAERAPLDKSVELRLVATALDRSLDELRAARERPRRIRQRLAALGSVAAAAAVLVGVVALVGTNSGSSKSSNASLSSPLGDYRGPATHSAATPARSVAFGDVSNPRALGAEVEARLAAARTPLTPANLPSGAGVKGLQGLAGGGSGDLGLVGPQGPSGVQGPTGPSGAQGATGSNGALGVTGPIGATGAQGPSPTGVFGDAGVSPIGPTGVTGPQVGQNSFDGLIGPQGVQGDEGVRIAAPAPKSATAAGVPAGIGVTANAEKVCTAAIRRKANLPSAAVLTGTGTDAGIPAVVAVFARGHTYLVYVLAASDCTLLAQQTLP